ncbi:hypothetical protein Tco_0222327 [Tanacetum coccineum]
MHLVKLTTLTLFLPAVVDSSPTAASVLLLDGSSNYSAEGEIVVSVSGNASNGVAVGFKAACNVNLGFPGFGFLPKWYLKIIDNRVALRHKGFCNLAYSSISNPSAISPQIRNGRIMPLSRLINGMRGRKTFSEMRVPVMMHQCNAWKEDFF